MFCPENLIDYGEKFTQIKNFLINTVNPIANIMDHDYKILKTVFQKFKQFGFLKFYTPKKYGGIELDRKEKIALQILLGQYGGALGFLVSQIGLPIRILMENESNKNQKYLNKILSKNLTIGNATSQMLSRDRQRFDIKNSGEDFILNGRILFATGYKIFDYLMVGVQSNDEDIFFIIPFNRKNIGVDFQVSNPYKPISMESLNTVSVEFKKFFIKSEEIILRKPLNWYRDLFIQSPPIGYTLGIAYESLNIIRESIENLEKLKPFRVIYRSLQEKLDHCIIKTQETISRDDHLFSEIIIISWECIQLSILISGGIGLLNNSAIQRFYRELPIYFTPVVTPSILENFTKYFL